MANLVATFVITFNVAILILLSFQADNAFLQVSAWVLATIFSISVIQYLFRGKKH